MTEETEEVLLVVEGLPPVSKEEVERIIEELSHLIMEYCGGENKTFVLEERNSEVEI
jgi:DNA/RNA-binding domain of Phe-tRNA-synthetase-like protein